MPPRQNHPPYELWKNLSVTVKQLRHDQTSAEAFLWDLLRDRRFHGYKFRRQHAINRFVVDFYCAEARLIIEVDGRIHEKQVEEDQERQQILEGLGFRMLRFTDDLILDCPEQALEQILSMLEVKR